MVISGKGGTGKTTITASLAQLFPDKIVADTDVDAANLFLLLKPSTRVETEFRGIPIASINPSICSACNLCREQCRFQAIDIHNGIYRVDPISCEGCRLCVSVCPVKAITMTEQTVGKWIVADTDCGGFVYARLNPGGENSGKLVTMVRNQARILAEKQKVKFILIDGPPGIGCPVISTLSGSDYALVVTEPTLSGISDLERILKLIEHFGIPRGLVINRYDINLENTKKIEKFALEKDIEILGKIPHSFCILNEISRQNIPLEFCADLKKEIKAVYKKLIKIFENNMEVKK